MSIHSVTGRTLRRALRAVLWMALLGVLVWPGTVLAQAAGPIYALRGMLSKAENQSYDTVLTAVDGSKYGLVGETPNIEAEIVLLRSQGADEIVKVWGDRYAATGENALPLIVVSAIQAEDSAVQQTPEPPVPTEPTPVPTVTIPTIVVEAVVINVRGGPGTSYPSIGTLVAGQSCTIVARNQDATWWRVVCSTGVNGWVFGELVAIIGAASQVPVEQPAPPPTPAPPTTYAGWKASFFANRNLSGNPVIIQDAPSINYHWGGGSPAANVPADNFSARFERTLNLTYGNYSINATVDDGVRIYVDDELLVNAWETGSARLVGGQRILNGSHRFRVEYFEATGDAQLVFNVSQVAASTDWQASYFNNRDLAGSPVATRGEPRASDRPLGFNWGSTSPVLNVVTVDNWSARWTGTFWFEGGDYRFRASVDDGVRVFLDGIRLIDVWQVGTHNDNLSNFGSLGKGNHTVTVEMFDATGGAYLFLDWERTGDGSGGRDQ